MNKPRIHFVLINEKENEDKFSKFLYYGLQLKLQTEIYFYECKKGFQIGAQDLYNSWFTDIMFKKGGHSVILVKHQEGDGSELSELFDHRIHAFYGQYNHFITSIDLNTKHKFGDEMYFVLMSLQMIPSIWGDYTDMEYGNLDCQRFLDFDHKPNNPGMNFD